MVGKIVTTPSSIIDLRDATGPTLVIKRDLETRIEMVFTDDQGNFLNLNDYEEALTVVFAQAQINLNLFAEVRDNAAASFMDLSAVIMSVTRLTEPAPVKLPLETHTSIDPTMGQARVVLPEFLYDVNPIPYNTNQPIMYVCDIRAGVPGAKDSSRFSFLVFEGAPRNAPEFSRAS